MVWPVIQERWVVFLGGLLKVVVEDLYKIIQNRKNFGEEGSYTKYLFDKGTDKIL